MIIIRSEIEQRNIVNDPDCIITSVLLSFLYPFLSRLHVLIFSSRTVQSLHMEKHISKYVSQFYGFVLLVYVGCCYLSVSTFLSVSLYVSLSLSPHLTLSMYLCLALSGCACLSLSLSIYLSTYLFIHPSILNAYTSNIVNTYTYIYHCYVLRAS